MRKIVILGGTLLALTLTLSLARADPPISQPAGPGSPVDQNVQAINQASDPSAAVTAYTSAVAAEPNSANVLAAFVGKMARFGLPEMAFHQAETLVQMDPNNGQAWVVVGYVQAKQGKMADSLGSVGRAAAKSPEDPFVQATAGQLVAWFDMHQAQPDSPADAQRLVDLIRQLLSTKTAFVASYTQAKDALASATSQPTNANLVPPPNAADYPQQAGGYQPGGYLVQPPDTYYTTPAYPQPYVGYPDYTDWWYPSGYFGYGFFVGEPFFFFGDRDDFRHHHDRDDFHHDHGDFRRDGGDWNHNLGGTGAQFNPLFRNRTGTAGATGTANSLTTGRALNRTWTGGVKPGATSTLHSTPSFRGSTTFNRNLSATPRYQFYGSGARNFNSGGSSVRSFSTARPSTGGFSSGGSSSFHSFHSMGGSSFHSGGGHGGHR